MTATRWAPQKSVEAELGVHSSTLRRWRNLGYVQSRREGPKLIYILVHADGPAAGRPVGLEEHLPAEEQPT